MLSTKAKKILNILEWVALAVLTVSAIIIPVTITISKTHNTKTYSHNDLPFEYNEIKQDFSSSKPSIIDENGKEIPNPEYEKDLEAQKFYNKNTLPITLEFPANNGGTAIVLGTIWQIFNPNDLLRTYFATNIHVMSDALRFNINETPIPISIESNINNRFKICVHDKKVPYKSTVLEDIKVEKISITEKYEKDLQTETANYSDFIVLSTKTNIFPESSKTTLDFIDTEVEFNNAIKQITELKEPLYISGFPAHKNEGYGYINYDYVNIKYKPKKLPYISTSFIELGANYNTEQNGLKIFRNLTQKFHSFANQLIMPNLDIPGGSSGSLVTIFQDNKLKPLGIWWGEYTSSLDPNIYGALDFFYSPDYHLINKSSLVSGYNNLPKWITNAKK